VKQPDNLVKNPKTGLFLNFDRVISIGSDFLIRSHFDLARFIRIRFGILDGEKQPPLPPLSELSMSHK